MPAGTANDQGQSFGIGSEDEDVEANVQILLAHHIVGMPRVETQPGFAGYHVAGAGQGGDFANPHARKVG